MSVWTVPKFIDRIFPLILPIAGNLMTKHEGGKPILLALTQKMIIFLPFTLYILLFTLYLPFLCWFYATLVFTVEINPFKPLSKPFRLTIMQRSGSAFIAMHCLSVAGNGSVTFYAPPPSHPNTPPTIPPSPTRQQRCMGIALQISPKCTALPILTQSATLAIA